MFFIVTIFTMFFITVDSPMSMPGTPPVSTTKAPQTEPQTSTTVLDDRYDSRGVMRGKCNAVVGVMSYRCSCDDYRASRENPDVCRYCECRCTQHDILFKQPHQPHQLLQTHNFSRAPLDTTSSESLNLTAMFHDYSSDSLPQLTRKPLSPVCASAPGQTIFQSPLRTGGYMNRSRSPAVTPYHQQVATTPYRQQLSFP